MILESAKSGDRQKLGQRLVLRGLLTEAALQQVLKRQKLLPPDQKVRRLGSLLIEAGLVSARQVAEALGEQRGIQPCSAAHGRPDKAVRAIFPKAVLQQFQAAPVGIIGKIVAIAMADPQDAEQVAILQSLTPYTVRPMQAAQIQVQQILATIKDTDGPPAPPIPLRPTALHHDREAVSHLAPATPASLASPASPAPPSASASSATSHRTQSSRSPGKEPAPVPVRRRRRFSFSWDGDDTVRLVVILLLASAAVSAGLLWKFQQDASAPVHLDEGTAHASVQPAAPIAAPAPAPRPDPVPASRSAEPEQPVEPPAPPSPPAENDP